MVKLVGTGRNMTSWFRGAFGKIKMGFHQGNASSNHLVAGNVLALANHIFTPRKWRCQRQVSKTITFPEMNSPSLTLLLGIAPCETAFSARVMGWVHDENIWYLSVTTLQSLWNMRVKVWLFKDSSSALLAVHSILQSWTIAYKSLHLSAQRNAKTDRGLKMVGAAILGR